MKRGGCCRQQSVQVCSPSVCVCVCGVGGGVCVCVWYVDVRVGVLYKFMVWKVRKTFILFNVENG